MTHRQLKTGYFVLAGSNTIATSYFLNFLFFFLRDHFGFGNRENLLVSALHGFLYTFAAWQCGKFARRRGCILSLKIGFPCLAAVMIVGAFMNTPLTMMLALMCYTVSLLLTWPALEALVSERETQQGVQRMVGIYNCTWAGGAALAYFTGGGLYDRFGRGAVFWLPAGMFLAQFFLVLWLGKNHDAVLAQTPEPVLEPVHVPEAAALESPVKPEAFLKMAWLASPFGYVAINTLFAVMPGIAQKLALSPTRVGLFCSVWMFGRFGAFALLWQWNGWHYKFRYMCLAFVMLIGSFTAILLAHELWIVVVAQLFFGLATGLIYYSSLFYSMDVGEASSEHGGLHEAFIGVGICVGPGLGALALYLWPNHPDAGAWAVSGLLVCGLMGLVGLRMKGK
jgi:predicted MFS family arabinose efflux permease